MNKNIHRVIFSAARGLWTVVQETATALGKGRVASALRGACAAISRAGRVSRIDMLSMRHVAFAALCVFGMQPVLANAQVVAAPSSGSKPVVGVTANGLPVVQITAPNSAGVSNNNYTQYNVGSQGLILNNASGNVQTQQAGYVAGNPNLVAGSARVIVNQVVGGSASQLLGYTEVAGQKAEVVIANPAGIVCNGCGFINTSRGVLTTGTPVFGGTGSLDAFHVRGGQIQVSSDGLNASNVDQVDLIARSVAVNGKIWAGQSLNVIAGNNDVRHDDLGVTALGADGNSPGVAIDVAQLGGMYAGKIVLKGTETGVGVNSAGTLAAQSGDLQLSSQGKVSLSGAASASGNLSIAAAGDVSISGSVYATQNTTVSSQGQVAGSGTIAALGNTSVTAASVVSGGTLGAGIDANGNVTGSGSLSVTGAGAITATGQQLAGGNLAMTGSSVNMAGAQTQASGDVSLIATGAGGDSGNIAHSGALLQAGGTLTANAAGTVTNDQGQASAAQLNVTAGALSNRGGTLSQTGTGDTTLAATGAFDNSGGSLTSNAQNTTIHSAALTNANGTISQAGSGALNVQTGALDNTGGTLATNGVATIAASSVGNRSGSITSAQALNVTSNGDIDNTAGQLQAAGAVKVSGANVQNAAGRIVSENGDGLTLTASGQIENTAGTTAQGATGGVIGGNGDATIRAATLANSGTLTAAKTLAVTTSGALDNSNGSMSAATLRANAASILNANGAISADSVSISAPQLDNSGGKITANQLDISATNLTNAGGELTQLGAAAIGLNVSGAIDNSSGGLIQSAGADMTLAPATLDNDGGTITHAGTGTLAIDTGAGALTNVGGKIATNGLANVSAGSIDNTGGAISAANGLNATASGALNNANGQLDSNADLSVASGTGIANTGGTMSAAGNVSVQAATLTNGGSITAGQSLDATITGTLDNSAGTLGAQTITASAASLKNSGGTISAHVVALTAPQLDDSHGSIIADQLALAATNLTNEGGTITQLGTGAMGLDVSGTLDNANGGVLQANSTDLTLAPATLNNDGGKITHAGSGTLTIDAANGAGAVTNAGGTIVSNGRTVLSAGSLDNTGGALGGQAGLDATVAGALNNWQGQLASNAGLSVASGALTNAGGTITATDDATINAALLTNSGKISAGQTLTANVAGTLDNSSGSLGGATVVANAAQLKNAYGTISANTTTVAATRLDNSSGQIIAEQLSLSAANLINEHGTLTQLGSGGMGFAVSGAFDNSNGGLLQSNSADLALMPSTLDNDGGTITHAGTGTLTIDAASGTGALSNAGGSIVSNGQTVLAAGSVDNTGGAIGGHAGLTATVADGLNNTHGQLASNADLKVSSGADLTNADGVITAAGNSTVQAASLTNTGNITAGQVLNATATSMLDNSGGTLSAQTVNAQAASLRNAGGVVSGNTVSATATGLDNSSGQIIAEQLSLSAANLANEHGSLTQLGSGAMGFAVSGTLDNSNGGVIQANSTDLTIAPSTLDNDSGTITHAGTGTLTLGAADGSSSLHNAGGKIVSNGLTKLSAASVDNTGGVIGGQGGFDATVSGELDNTRGQIASNADFSLSGGAALTNTGGTIAATGNGTLQAASLTNGGSITAGQRLGVAIDGTLDNSNGTLSAQTLTASAASFRNASGLVSGDSVAISAPQLDNSGGRLIANQLALRATNLSNEGGTITQLGSGSLSLDVSDTLDNANGGVLQSNSTDLTITPASLDNSGGTITHAGSGTLTIVAGNGAGSLSNAGGKIITNGAATVSAGTLDNTHGTLSSQNILSAVVQGVLNNTSGRLSSGTGLSASSGDQLINAAGVIGAGGVVAGSTLSLSAASIDNSGGAITNVGTGTTTLEGGSSITNANAGGVSGMGSISGNGDVTLAATSISNTQGGQLSGANLQINAGNLDNSGGTIGNVAHVANVAGDVAISATGNLTGTGGRIGASRNLSLTANSVLGGGAYSAVGNLALNLQGDFTTSPSYSFNAGGTLAFSLPGTFTNVGGLSAANGLSVSASNIKNSGALVAGGMLTTHSTTLTNTGTIVGGSVSLNATQTLSNVGTSALIGATDSAGTLELLAQDIENRDDTTATDSQATTAIYGLGKVVLAGGKDAGGNYINATLVHNQSALIQSFGDMTIDANQVTNTRREMTTTGLTSSVDPALLDSLGISMSGCTAIYMEACSGQSVGWVVQGDPNLIGGAYTQVPHGGQWNSGYQYTTYTGVAVANTVASISPEAQILAGGNLNTSTVSLFQNHWSQVAATGNIAGPTTLDQNSWQGQTAPQVQVTYSGEYHYNNYDNSEHNWQLPFGDAGFVTSNPGGYSQPAPADIRTYALPGYESSFVANGTLSGTGMTIDNTAGNAGVAPLGLLPGQSLTATGAGAINGTIGSVPTGGTISAGAASGTISSGSTGGAIGAGLVSGTIGTGSAGGAVSANAVSGSIAASGGSHASTVAVQGGKLANSGLANSGNPTIAAATAVKVLNNITVPSGGLFSADTAPNAPYLIETNPAFANQQQWLSSNYYFQQMGMDPQQTQMRLGDGFYEQQLVQNQILSMTGKSVLTNYADTQDEFKALMTSGAQLAKSLDLAPGTGLTPDQVAQLTSNVVIMQTQVVDGQSVLVPVVYLAKASQENMANGPVIAATDIDLQNAQTVTNSGTISATNSFAVDAQNIDSSFGTLQSGGQLSLVSAGNVNLTSATVNAGTLALQAGNDVILNTAVNSLHQANGDSVTRDTSTLGPLASINVTGNAAIVTGGNLEQNAAALNVGGALGMSIGGNWNLGVAQTGETKVVLTASSVSDTHLVSDTGSSVKVGGASMIAVGGDLTASGAKLDLGGGGTVAAGGNVTLQAATATSTVDDSSSGHDHHGSYSASLHTSDDAVTGTTINSGDNLSVLSGKDIDLSGSSITLTKGTATLAAAGDVNIAAASETHVSDFQASGSHSGVLSSTSRESVSNNASTQADASLISADSVAISAGKNLNVTGSNIVGTDAVALAATGDVNLSAATETYQDNEYYQEKHSGFSFTGGLGISVGSSEQHQQYDAGSVTQSQARSTVGASAGNVSIVAGGDLHVGGSDVVAGKAAADTSDATGNIALQAQNIVIDPGQDAAQSHDEQEAHSSGLTVAITGTPLDTVKNLRADASSGNAFERGQNTLLEVGASAADTPGISVSYGRSSSSSTTDLSSVTNAGSTLRAGGNVTVNATGGAVKDASGKALDGDITVTGSAISAGGTALFNANHDVTFQASTDQLQQSTQSSSSSSGFSLAAPSLGDVTRWVGGTANSDGVGPSPYNAASSSANGTQTANTQTASTVVANSVVVKSDTGDINVIGSGISGTQGVDLVASQGAINVLAGLDSSTNHQESSSKKIGGLGSNGTSTGFSVGVASNHGVEDSAAQTQSTMRSQLVSANGNVTLDAKQDVTVQGSDLSAGGDLALTGKNLNLDPGTDGTQSSASQSSSQFGVSLALGGAVGNAVATINQSMNQASSTDNSRLKALDVAQAGLATYNAIQVARASMSGPTAQPLIKATVSIGGGTSHSQTQQTTLANDGSTLTAGHDVTLVATGSDTKDASGAATDGDINAAGTRISGQNVTLDAARDINLQSARDASEQSSSNSSSNGSIGVGLAVGGQQNGFTVELAASMAHGNANGQSSTNQDTQIAASNMLSLMSGRDTNLRGAEVAGNSIDANVGRDLNVASQQDTSTYASKQTSGGFQASLCIPPICVGQAVSGSASFSQQTIDSDYQSVNQQSGFYARNGGFDINVGNHTQLDGGVIASTASPELNNLSTQTLGFTNLENHASYSGDTVGLSASGGFGHSTKDGVTLSTPVAQGANHALGPQTSQGLGPSGVSLSGTSSDASGTTYAAVSAGTITVREDAGTGQDSTAGLSRDTANANGVVQNTFNAQTVQDDMAIQQATGQVGMQVVGDVAQHFEQQAASKISDAQSRLDSAKASGDTAAAQQAQADLDAADAQIALWSNDGAARIASHAAVAAIGAALGGGSVQGAVAGTVAGDLASNATAKVVGDTLSGTLLSNPAAGLAGAVAGGGVGGTSGAVSGVGGALSADLYNRQLHPEEIDKILQLAKGNTDLFNRLVSAACVDVNCSGEFAVGSQNEIHYSQIEAGGGMDAEAQEILQAAHNADPSFLSYSKGAALVDQILREANTIGQSVAWTRQFALAAGSAFVNGATEFGLTIADGLSAVGGGVGNPVSELGQSIQRTGVVQTGVNTLAGFSDTMQGVGQWSPSAVGSLVGSAALAYLTDKIAAGTSNSISAGIDSALGGYSIRDVNSVYPADGRTMNCANCSVATDATLAGNPTSALPGAVTSPEDLATAFGKTVFNWIQRTNPEAISQTMLNWGDGSRAVVYGARGGEIGHFSNVINQNGTVRFLDGQSGGATNLNDGYTHWFILRTDN
ncbi:MULTISPECIES: hemagglutinin repeat-containing protein [unclassified Paraburkholderia]|uniref:hemagglutinin repeat-containing protein n=1 Tax=unclassified Paraburkholderia TaxID=2615204 RepID=UPI002AB0BD96|nr:MULTISPECIES: hemagglutinin repeat-containing protein [unclassified Paraburkholderia]